MVNAKDQVETFISEPITPDAGTFDTAAMARGEPGLPTGFAWRGKHYEIAEVLEAWKGNGREGEAAKYLRRHWFKVRVGSGEVMTLYCLRQSRDGKKRWWMYCVGAK